jgi:RNA polymerase sigma-70 factor (ECF subfamily)
MATAYLTPTTFVNPGLEVEYKEASLIREVLAGRTELLEDLMKPHLAMLRRLIQRKMGNDPEVEDIVQQTMLKSFTHLKQFRFEACFRTWLIRIALNEIAQCWRRRVPGRWIGLECSAQAMLHAADSSECPFRSYERSQTADSLQRAVNSLPEAYRVVVRMRDLEERSISEVAEALCLSIGAVKSRHHRGRSRMADLLSRPRKVTPASDEIA